jgi:DNA-binding GntR family transcriptional regulator
MAEHRRVVEAIEQRDPKCAEEAIEAHMRTGVETVIQILENFVVKGDRF